MSFLEQLFCLTFALMITQSDINAWEQANRSFLIGIRLLTLVGKHPQLVKKANRYIGAYPPTEDVINRVAKAVLSLLPAVVPTVSKETQVANASAAPESDALAVTVEQLEDEPESIMILRAKLKYVHKRHDDAKGRLFAASSNVERFEISKEIMEDIVSTLDAGYARIREWAQTGEEPGEIIDKEENKTAKEQAGADFKRMNSLVPRISRLKSFIKDKKLPEEIKEQYKAELIDKEIELTKLKKEYGI